jgi:hypothetical protein
MGRWGASAKGDGWSASASGDKSRGGGKKGCLVMSCVLSSGMLAGLSALGWAAFRLIWA